MRMSQTEKTGKEDIDQLLYLKEIAPTVPDSVFSCQASSAIGPGELVPVCGAAGK